MLELHERGINQIDLHCHLLRTAESSAPDHRPTTVLAMIGVRKRRKSCAGFAHGQRGYRRQDSPSHTAPMSAIRAAASEGGFRILFDAQRNLPGYGRPGRRSAAPMPTAR